MEKTVDKITIGNKTIELVDEGCCASVFVNGKCVGFFTEDEDHFDLMPYDSYETPPVGIKMRPKKNDPEGLRYMKVKR